MRSICFALVVLVVAPVAVRAGTGAGADQPWAVGVSDTQKAQAQKLLEQGNALFLEKKYAEALEKFKGAVAVWDHPAIRFNMVRCLIQLDRPVDASDNLALALKYGAAPMEEAVYNEALSYQKLLANQIGDLDVHCEQAGVRITLDGQPLINCPGKEHRRVAPGQHQIVGTKDGFLTKTTEVVVLGAKEQNANVALVPLTKAAKIVHRWPAWIPWTVFGGGLAVVGAGGLVQLLASNNMNLYDRGISRDCVNVGCAPNSPQIDGSLKDRAELENKIAIGVMSLGAAVAVVGGAMLYMNRGQTVYEGGIEKIGPATVDIVPHNGGGIMTLSGHW